jgi:hypothetical protein
LHRIFHMWNLKFAIGTVQIGASADMIQPLPTQICHYPMRFKATLKMARDSTTFSWLLKTNATPNFFLLTKVPLSSKKNWLHLNSPKFIFFQKLWFLGACSRLSFKKMQPGQKKIYHNVCIQSFGLFFTLKEIGGRCKKEWVRNKGSVWSQKNYTKENLQEDLCWTRLCSGRKRKKEGSTWCTQ